MFFFAVVVVVVFSELEGSPLSAILYTTAEAEEREHAAPGSSTRQSHCLSV